MKKGIERHTSLENCVCSHEFLYEYECKAGGENPNKTSRKGRKRWGRLKSFDNILFSYLMSPGVREIVLVPSFPQEKQENDILKTKPPFMAI